MRAAGRGGAWFPASLPPCLGWRGSPSWSSPLDDLAVLGQHGTSTSMVSGYFRPVPVLKSTTRSDCFRRPSCAACAPRPALPRPPGTMNIPSTAAASCIASRISSSVTATAQPCVSRMARSTRKSPSALGTRMPRRRWPRPPRTRRPPGPPRRRAPAARSRLACAAMSLGRSAPIQPSASSSSKAFHMPIRPTPPPRRVDDRVGQPPLELLGHLQAHRLLALDPVRLLEGGGVEPAVLDDGRVHEPPRVGDEPVHQVEVGPGDDALLLVDVRRVDGHGDVGPDAGARAVGGPRRRPRCPRCPWRRR